MRAGRFALEDAEARQTILSPFFRCFVVSVTRPPSTASVCFFADGGSLPTQQSICLSVTVACATAFAGGGFICWHVSSPVGFRDAAICRPPRFRATSGSPSR